MSLNNGFYESVINKLIYCEILKLQENNDKYIDKKEIDKEEGSSVISKYLTTVINNSLSRIYGEDKQNRQIEICNKIIHLIIEELKLDDFNDFIINENAELLLAVMSNLDNAYIDSYKNKKIRPITSLAANSLFTGAQKNLTMIRLYQ